MFPSVSSSRIASAQMSSITKSRLLIIEMRRSDVFFFSFSSAQNIENINSVCVIMPPPSPGRMSCCCSRDNSPASTDNPGYSDVFVFSFSSAQNIENISSVCVIMPPSSPGRMISCGSRDNSPASTDNPGYSGGLAGSVGYDEGTATASVAAVLPTALAGPPGWRRRRAGGAAACPAPVRARRLQEAGPDRVATMRVPQPPPSPGRRAGGAAGLARPPRTRSGRIDSGRPGRIGGRRRRRRRRRPSDGPGRAARPAVPRAPHRSERVGSRACLIGPSFACPAQQQGKPLCFYFPAPRCGHCCLPLLAAPAPGPSLQRPLLPAPPGTMAARALAVVEYKTTIIKTVDNIVVYF
jgi:hypothetical protein